MNTIEQYTDFSMKRQIKLLMKVTSKKHLKLKSLTFLLKTEKGKATNLFNSNNKKKKRKKEKRNQKKFFYVEECTNQEETGSMNDLTSVSLNINSLA